MTALIRILVVDDDADIRSLMAEILAGPDREVHLAPGGREAVECVDTMDLDLVILDLSMPGMDGWETATQIRRRSGVPLLIVTARVADGERLRGSQMGAEGFMLKPFLRRELIGAVENILEPPVGPAIIPRAAARARRAPDPRAACR